MGAFRWIEQGLEDRAGEQEGKEVVDGGGGTGFDFEEFVRVEGGW